MRFSCENKPSLGTSLGTRKRCFGGAAPSTAHILGFVCKSNYFCVIYCATWGICLLTRDHRLLRFGSCTFWSSQLPPLNLQRCSRRVKASKTSTWERQCRAEIASIAYRLGQIYVRMAKYLESFGVLPSHGVVVRPASRIVGGVADSNYLPRAFVGSPSRFWIDPQRIDRRPLTSKSVPSGEEIQKAYKL